MTRPLYWLRIAFDFTACALFAAVPFYVFVEVMK